MQSLKIKKNAGQNNLAFFETLCSTIKTFKTYCIFYLYESVISKKKFFRWTPSICIINSKDAAIHRSPSENTFVILYEHGLVWSNFRLKVKAPCKMDLKMFPFDSIQVCLLGCFKVKIWNL